MLAGICSSCQKNLSYVDFKEIDVQASGSTRWVGVAYVCPLCETILSIQIDPVALKADTIDGVAALLRK
jgi:hypothetical protein